MSMADVYQLVEALPWALRDQIIRYASAVNDAVPEIVREARVELSRRLRDDIVVVAALKKLHAIMTLDRWAIDRMLSYLDGHDIAGMTLGSQLIVRGDSEYAETAAMLRELNTFLSEHDLLELVMTRTYAEIASKLEVRYRED